MVKQVENFFTADIQKAILDLVTSIKFAWYHVPLPNFEKVPQIKKLCDNDNNIVLKSGFQHIFYYRRTEQICDTYINNINLVELFSEYTEKNFQIKVKKPMRISGLLSLPVSNYDTNSYLLPHVDFFVPHKTLIYYVNDSDGDTFVFKEKCMVRTSHTDDYGTLLDHDNSYQPKTLQERVTPVQGKAILINGLNYHAGSMPRNKLRYVINFNFQ